MPSTPESLLRTELQATGENATTWGVKTNNNIELLAEAIAGVANVNVGGSGNYTLVASNYVSDEARPATLVLTGTLSGNRDVIVPTSPKHYTVHNQTSGAFTLTIRQSAGTGLVVPPGTSQIVCTSTTCVDAIGATPFVKTFLDDVDAATARSTLGLGSAATLAATSVGASLVVAADTSAARLAIGASSVGSSLIIATDTSSARGAIEAAKAGPATASGLTLATAHVLGRVTAGSGAVEEIPFGNAAAALSLGINRSAEQATTSGTAIDFTGIPAGVRRVTATLRQVSTTTPASPLALRLGTSSGIVSTGYDGIHGFYSGAGSGYSVNSTGILITSSDGVLQTSGILTLVNQSGNLWLGTFEGFVYNGVNWFFSESRGFIDLGGVLDRLRLTTVAGTPTFDAGAMNIMWEF